MSTSSATLLPAKSIAELHSYSAGCTTYKLSLCGYVACEDKCVVHHRYLGPSNIEKVYITINNTICIKFE